MRLITIAVAGGIAAAVGSTPTFAVEAKLPRTPAVEVILGEPGVSDRDDYIRHEGDRAVNAERQINVVPQSVIGEPLSTLDGVTVGEVEAVDTIDSGTVVISTIDGVTVAFHLTLLVATEQGIEIQTDMADLDLSIQEIISLPANRGDD